MKIEAEKTLKLKVSESEAIVILDALASRYSDSDPYLDKNAERAKDMIFLLESMLD